MYRKLAFTAATALLTVATGSPALAQQITRVVSYHDLDLTKVDGVKMLHHRVIRAVNYVCRFEPAGGSLLRSPNQECRRQVMRNVKPKMVAAVELAQKRAAEIQLASR